MLLNRGFVAAALLVVLTMSIYFSLNVMARCIWRMRPPRPGPLGAVPGRSWWPMLSRRLPAVAVSTAEVPPPCFLEAWPWRLLDRC